MNSVLTFERVEQKYRMNRIKACQFFEKINPYVRNDRYPHYSLYNIYFDSEDFCMISRSVEGADYKEKLRIRSYGDIRHNDFVYAEMKRKCNGIVYKRRIQIASSSLAQAFTDSSQIGREISYMKDAYQAVPKVFIAYDRHAFISKTEADVRITFDTDIRYRLNHLELMDYPGDICLLEKDSVLVEIKVMNRYPLWLVHALHDVGATRTSFSKYGTIYTEILKERQKHV